MSNAITVPGARGVGRTMCLALALAFLLAGARPAAAEKFSDSDEAKEGQYKTGCVITDYSDVTTGDGVNWVWLAPDAKLGGPGNVEIVSVKNISDVTDAALAGTVESDFKQAFARVGKTVAPGGLKITSCVYWVERANTAKMFIPFAGGHLAQAGIGIELIVVDASGRTVSKIRHDGRNGAAPSAAAGAVVDDIANFSRAH
jgi:hypothetical protein